MKKLILLSLFVLLIGGFFYIQYKNNYEDSSSKELSNSSSEEKSYKEVIINDDPDRPIGRIVEVNENQVSFKKIVELECFPVIDYTYESDPPSNLSSEEADKMYNTKQLPWCTPYHLLKEVENVTTLPIPSSVELFVIQYDKDGMKLVKTDKVKFQNLVQETPELLFHFTIKDSLIVKIEQKYQE